MTPPAREAGRWARAALASLAIHAAVTAVVLWSAGLGLPSALPAMPPAIEIVAVPSTAPTDRGPDLQAGAALAAPFFAALQAELGRTAAVGIAGFTLR